MKILNLYAGLGGNVLKLDNDLYEVTAIENEKKIADEYQRQNPTHKVVIGDAIEFLLAHWTEFDVFWVSPTCQTHGRMVKATKHRIKKMPDMSLYQEIIFLDNFVKAPWVVENVIPYYKPLIEPTIRVGRHLFWSNKPLFGIQDIKRPPGFINSTTVEGSENLKKWLGINYEGNIYYKGNHCPGQVLRNCVHPDLGLQIFNSLNL